jgi:Holliday junction resolvase
MTNYRKGYNFERECKELLEKEGYFVVRSAGSHSPFDLVAFNENETLLLQLKRAKKIYLNSLVTLFKRDLIENKLEYLTKPQKARVEVWTREDDNSIVRTKVFL